MSIDRLVDGHHAVTRRDLLRYGAGATTAGALAAYLAACGGDSSSSSSQQPGGPPSRGGTIKLALNAFSSQDSLDPAINFYLSGLLTNGLFYDTLLKTDNAWGVQPNLAEDWSSSADNKTWTFKLRRGVEFHTGGTMTARDVAESIARIIDPEVGSIGAAFFAPVLDAKGIRAVDDTTVRFTLLQPDAFFPQRVASNYSRVHKAGATFKSSEGTGPFKSTSFTAGTGFEAVRNEGYWEDGLPYLDAVNLVATPDAATTTEGVLSGDTDFSDVPNFAAAPQIASSSSAAALSDPFGFAYDIEVNGSVKPFDDPDVRMALKMLVDRQKYADVAFKGEATVSADSYVHPEDPYYPTDLEPPPFDPEQAKALLEKAGAAGAKIEVNTATIGGTSDLAVLFAESLKAGGLDATVKQLPSGEFDKRLGVEPVAVTYWQRFHPALVLSYYYGTEGPFNYAKFSDPAVDKALADVLSVKDEAGQKGMIGEAVRAYAEGAATIWPVHSNSFWAHKKRLQGLVVHPTEVVDFRRASLA